MNFPANACAWCGGHDHARACCPWAEQLRPAQRYEAEKHAWLLEHAGAPPEQYEAAAREIAERVGV